MPGLGDDPRKLPYGPEAEMADCRPELRVRKPRTPALPLPPQRVTLLFDLIDQALKGARGHRRNELVNLRQAIQYEEKRP